MLGPGKQNLYQAISSELSWKTSNLGPIWMLCNFFYLRCFLIRKSNVISELKLIKWELSNQAKLSTKWLDYDCIKLAAAVIKAKLPVKIYIYYIYISFFILRAASGQHHIACWRLTALAVHNKTQHKLTAEVFVQFLRLCWFTGCLA